MKSTMPKDFTAWPPPAVASVWEDIRRWGAWWSGDPNDLANAYGATAGIVGEASPAYRASQFSGGLVGGLARMFWGTPKNPTDQSSKLHVPIAADIVNTAADLLFGDRPSFVIGDPREKEKEHLPADPAEPKKVFSQELGVQVPNPKARITKGQANAAAKSRGMGAGKTDPKGSEAATRPGNAPGDGGPGDDLENPDNAAQPQPEDPAQQRLDELFGKKTMSALQSAARVQSGLGGVYCRVVWDETVADYPILDVIHPDAAIPAFKWDHLTEVTFWREIHNDKGEVWRHLERHYTVIETVEENAQGVRVAPLDKGMDPTNKTRYRKNRATGEPDAPKFNPESGMDEGGKPELEKIGYVEHAVFTGDTTSIGLRRAWSSMADWPDAVMDAMAPHLELMMETIARLPMDDPEAPGAPDMSQFGTYTTGLPMLDVVFIPGAENVQKRDNPLARKIGMADFGQVTHLMDQLDEAWTSWMRDVRLGRARIFVPQEYLENLGPGKGAQFNNDQEIYIPVTTLAGSASDAPGLAMEMFQPDIRYEAHERTTLALAAQCISKSGYSEQTFGLTGEVAMTATESNARERKTAMTIAGKEGAWQVALPQICKMMMKVDELFFSGLPVDDDITVEFAPFATDGMVEQSATLSTLKTAGLISQRSAIRQLHPDWDDDQIDAELLEIDNEAPEPPMDPFGIEREAADAALKEDDGPPPPGGGK